MAPTYPTPPFPKQHQPMPGKTGQMQPNDACETQGLVEARSLADGR